MKPEDVTALERDFLAACLANPGGLADVVTVVSPDDLRHDAHQRVYRVMGELWQHGTTVDPVSVLNALEAKGEAKEDVGYQYFCDLALRDPVGGGIVHTARVLREKALLRRLALVGQDIQGLATMPTGPAQEVVDQALRMVMELSSRASPQEAIPLAQAGEQLLDVLDARSGRTEGAGGVKTGFADLDRPLAQLGTGTLTLIAGRTGQGKTTLALNVAKNVSWSGSPVLFCSLEQSAVDLAEKVLCLETGLHGQRVQGGYLTREEVDQVSGAVTRWPDRPLWLYDRASQSVLGITALARRIQARSGLGLLVVDYIGLLTPEDRRAKRHEQVAEISRSLKVLAGDLGIPVLALAQLNREVDHRPNKKPQLSDLRESGALEQDADAVILISRGDGGQMVLELAKNRRGPTQDLCLAYDRSTHRISNLAREDWYGQPGYNGPYRASRRDDSDE